MAFAATKFSLLPPIVRRGCYNTMATAAAASSVSKAVVASVSPPLPFRSLYSSSLLPPTYPSPLSLSLSLGRPDSPRNHFDFINNSDEEISSGTNHMQSKSNFDVYSSSLEIVAAAEEKTKNTLVDEEILCRSSPTTTTTTSIDDSRINCFQLFGIWLENNNNLVDDKEILVLEDCLKPFKKRKRAAIEDEDEDCCRLKLLPLKKRRYFFHVQDESMYFKMRKVLTHSDVNNSARLLLGNKQKIVQLLSNMNITDANVKIKIYDSDTRKETTLMLKRWRTMSYVLTTGWGDKFVRSRNLQKGDMIELQWDQNSNRLNFSVVYKAPLMAIPLASCSPDAM